MKKTISIILSLVSTLIATAEMNGPFYSASTVEMTTEQLDTMSYALGHQFSLGMMAGENHLMQEEKDFYDYIRGFEDSLTDDKFMNDSSYVVSYSLGGMQGVFMTDGRSQEDLKKDLPCVITGLRKYLDGTIILPDDTIRARTIINNAPDKPEGDELCEYLTAIGILKAYTPGLQQYLDEMVPGKGLSADRRAFVAGMVDMLDMAVAGEPKTAYDLGKIVACSIKLRAIGLSSTTVFDKASCLVGAKAALGLGKNLIPRDTVERFLEEQFSQEDGAYEQEDNGMLEKMMDYLSKLKVELETRYSVNWNLKVLPVASNVSSAVKPFYQLLNAYLPDETVVPGALMVSVPGYNDEELFTEISTAIKSIPLPNGFQWFCFRDYEMGFTLGISQSDGEFDALVKEAYIETTPHAFQLIWNFDKGAAALWSLFTEDNIGNNVVVEINGQPVMAPRINNRIESGSCAASNVLPEIVNELFKDAVPVVSDMK